MSVHFCADKLQTSNLHFCAVLLSFQLVKSNEWPVFCSLYPGSIFLPSAKDANIPCSPAGSSPHFKSSRNGRVYVLLITHPGQQFDLQKPCLTSLYSCFTWNHAQWNLLFCVPETWIWSIFCLQESMAELGLPAVPKHHKIDHLQGGRRNKKATGKISSVEPGSLLLVTTQNIWGKNYFQCSSVINPCGCIHLLLPSFRPFHPLVPWCFILQSPAPAGSLMWTSPAHLKHMTCFCRETTT